MRLLLTNDDGFHAKGIQALAAAFLARGDTVWMVAPKANKSGTSCCLTLDRPLAVKSYSDTHFSVDGTPADCVHIALTGLASVDAFDAVVSGINDGANLGDDAIHSGTLGAATQAHLYGLPALAVSLTERGWTHLDTAVQTTLVTLDRLLARPTPELWNLNVPNLPATPTLPTVQWARIGRRTASQPSQALLSPKGEQYFWLGAGGHEIPDAGTDMAAIAAGFASLTPITLDRTDLAALAAYQSAA
jgi:5'-nucleotidase